MNETTKIIYPEWRDSNKHRKFPFSDDATLINDDGIYIPNNVFLDARFYTKTIGDTVFMSKLAVVGDKIQITIADSPAIEICTGTYDRSSDTETVEFYDFSGRPAGVMVINPSMLSTLVTGTIEYNQYQTPFVSSVLMPVPTSTVSGIIVDGTNTKLTGDVWLVGGDGVVLSRTIDGHIKVDMVGEPLFVRKSFADNNEEFQPPTFVKSIDGLLPDLAGNFNIVAGMLDDYILLNESATPNAAVDNVIRVVPIDNGLEIYLAGTKNG